MCEAAFFDATCYSLQLKRGKRRRPGSRPENPIRAQKGSVKWNKAARAFDRAAVRCKGMKAVTNFDVNEYKDELAEFEDRKRNNHDELQGKPRNAEALNTT